LVGWQTDVVHDEPQAAAAGRRNRLRLSCDHGGYQAYGRDESGKLVQKGSDPESWLFSDLSAISAHRV
jgi:hypothetical protein